MLVIIYNKMYNYGSISEVEDDISTTTQQEESSRQQPIISAEICVVLYTFVYSVISSVQVQYVEYMERLDPDTSEEASCSNESSSEELDLKTRVNFIVLGLIVASSGTSFLAVPVISQISLRFGYKRGLLINISLLLLSCCVWLISVLLESSYWWLVLAQVINGIGGGVAGSQALVTAYLSLIYDNYHLTQRLVVTGSLTQLFIGVAQLLVGFVISDDNFSSSFIMATSIAAAATLYTALCIRHIPSNIDITEPGILKKIKKLIKENSSAENVKFLLIGLVLCGHWGIMRATITISVIYVISYPLCWNSETVGYFLGLLFGLGSVGPLLVYFGTIPDLYLCLLGIASSALLILCCAFGYNTEIMFVGASLSLFRAVVGAALLAYISKMYPHPSSKVALAIAGCWIAIGEIMAPGVYQTIYGFTLQISSSIVFFIMAFLYIPCALVISIYAGLLPSWNIGNRDVNEKNAKREDLTESLLNTNHD
ncbi:proton-coupled folate transporter-like [Antedon mediterranea]|uniref:proton-coupled folate transporter-like n=1 Tax=Antedon mediterranea TaxID=105859 RepID=UPI003AF96D72